MVRWKNSKRTGDLLLLANVLVWVMMLNVLASFYFFRIDLTEEKRYTIQPQTRALLQTLEDDVFVEVFLEGEELNPEFRRLQKSIRETLDEFRIYSGNKVKFVFTDPLQANNERARNEFIADLNARGVMPRNVIETRNGERIEKFVFPGALVSYQGFETGVMLLRGNRAQSINQSIEVVEFELANAIQKLSNTDRKRIGLLRGHGELDSLVLAGFNNALLDQYDVFKVSLDRKQVLTGYDLIVIAKPTRAFTEQDKFKLDQYIMNGGKVMFLLDRLDADMNRASEEDYFAFPYDLNLDDQLFRYGVRINPDLVQDRVSGRYPVVVGGDRNQPQIMQLEWPFFPLVNQYAQHPVTRNLDATLFRFVSSIDTVKATGVIKTPLAFSSVYARKITAPVKVTVNDLRRQMQDEAFQGGPIMLGYLLEGRFTSLYKNRFAPAGVDTAKFSSASALTKLVVIADGDLARNDVNPRDNSPQPLGLDPFTQYTFANQDLLLNTIAFMLDENGLIKARNKEVKVRPLDKVKIKNERVFWQSINLVLPLLVLLAFGVGRAYWRSVKYSRF
ncbi:MAG TPA: gliding motility-associated ABC transporter substrate-binding protein GldG [Cyclobacteriaceae bacterium]|jgi:ABC-2 type transport system permease protein|nr:gliding motility-associated ABC transporter substrate-binding protein GldG [Cytophagales bacterium]HRE66305.1 gliding motility-associated ABC transporter substrate-binding protein GldG [Cyclobacteriaceae bacterium]HRF32873.1 gliding motility-associated ABC transporter substrate-binding protein GldG [Cyclobacteriaceae bacterium]